MLFSCVVFCVPLRFSSVCIYVYPYYSFCVTVEVHQKKRRLYFFLKKSFSRFLLFCASLSETNGEGKGYEESRAAVAKYYSTEKSPLTADDVVLTSGCSGAICLVIPALANPVRARASFLYLFSFFVFLSNYFFCLSICRVFTREDKMRKKSGGKERKRW